MLRPSTATNKSPFLTPAFSPGPLTSIRLACRWSPLSNHQTPSYGIENSRSFWKLIQAKATAATLSSAISTNRNRDWRSFAIGLGGWVSRSNGATEGPNRLLFCNFDATRDAALLLANPCNMSSFQNYKSSAGREICFMGFSCEIPNLQKLLKRQYLGAA